jgi:hypothetical protein
LDRRHLAVVPQDLMLPLAAHHFTRGCYHLQLPLPWGEEQNPEEESYLIMYNHK